MPASPRLLLALPFLVAACTPSEVTARVGGALLQVDGDLALADGDGGPPDQQDIGTAFGLGSQRASPYVQVEAAFGGPRFGASVLWLRESDRGELDRPFGGLPAGTVVESDLELTLLTLEASYEFDLGFVRLAPGVTGDVVLLDFVTTEPLLGNGERIDDAVLVPLPSLRASGDLGPLTLSGRIGYLEADRDRTGGRFLDVEATVEWRVDERLFLFGGCRRVDVDGNGRSGEQSFDADLAMTAWLFGGGIRF